METIGSFKPFKAKPRAARQSFTGVGFLGVRKPTVLRVLPSN